MTTPVDVSIAPRLATGERMPPRTSANKTTPVIDLAAGTLTVPAADGGAATVLRVGTLLFQTWLTTASRVYVMGGAVPFSLTRVTVQRGIYWQAYRNVEKKRRSRHIGDHAAVTVAKLREAADVLA